MILLDQSVLWLGENLDERGFVEFMQDADHRQATDEFRNQPKANQILRLHVGQRLRLTLGTCFDLGMEPERLVAQSSFDNFFQSYKRPPADEQNVRRIDRKEFLMRVFATALWRNVRDRAFQDF